AAADDQMTFIVYRRARRLNLYVRGIDVHGRDRLYPLSRLGSHPCNHNRGVFYGHSKSEILNSDVCASCDARAAVQSVSAGAGQHHRRWQYRQYCGQCEIWGEAERDQVGLHAHTGYGEETGRRYAVEFAAGEASD